MTGATRSKEEVLTELVQSVLLADELAARRIAELRHRDELVAEAFALGLAGTAISKVAGMSIGRTYQIKDKAKAS